jgi:hypothetical protein
MNYVIKHLDRRARESIPTHPKVLIWAVQTGRIGLVRALEEYGLRCSTCALVEAVHTKHWDVMKYVYKRLREDRVTTPPRVWSDIIRFMRNLYVNPAQCSAVDPPPDLQYMCKMASMDAA